MICQFFYFEYVTYVPTRFVKACLLVVESYHENHTTPAKYDEKLALFQHYGPFILGRPTAIFTNHETLIGLKVAGGNDIYCIFSAMIYFSWNCFSWLKSLWKVKVSQEISCIHGKNRKMTKTLATNYLEKLPFSMPFGNI